MAYAHYQTTQSEKWGTPDYRFGQPPTPGWEPQGRWGGQDYFLAHGFGDDQAFYQAVMSRMSAAAGVGFNEARHWHRRIYGGLVNLSQVLPADIGAAAAYEAYRIYKYRGDYVFSPLGQDIERQREALIAMAVAETTQLWQFTGRALDSYGKQDAAEAAAATASRIARRVVVQEDVNAQAMGAGMAPGMGGGMGGMGGGMGAMGGGMGGIGGGMGGMGGMGYGGMGAGAPGMIGANGMGVGAGGPFAGGAGMGTGAGMGAGMGGMGMGGALGSPGNPVVRDFANGIGGRPRGLRRVSSASSVVGGAGMGAGAMGGQMGMGGAGPMTSPSTTPMPGNSGVMGTPAPPPGEGPAVGGMPVGWGGASMASGVTGAGLGGAAGFGGMGGGGGAAGLAGGAGAGMPAPGFVAPPATAGTYPAMGGTTTTGAIYAPSTTYPAAAGGAGVGGAYAQPAVAGAYGGAYGGYGGYGQGATMVPQGSTVIFDRPRRRRHRASSFDSRR